MTTLVAQIAPQRNTQYATLSSALAPQELRLSPLGSHLSHLQPLRLGGQDYLRFDLPAPPDEVQSRELATLAMTRAYFVYYEKIGRNLGPLLRPLEIAFEPALPPALVEARRYRGKTNEDFTHFLCNIARFSSQFSDHPWRGLRIFDPLAGGGTTLFTALILGADAAGVEENLKEVEASAGFVRQFMRAQRITLQEQPDRLKKVGQRWRFTIGRRKVAQHCLLAAGDTVDAKILLGGFKPHLIVTDLPYGIQHQGVLADLLAAALPIWASLLPVGGALAFAWESSRFPRSDMIRLVEAATSLTVLNHPPYDSLAHRVDRVIKERDVLVAQR